MGYYADLAIQAEIDAFSHRAMPNKHSFHCDECGKGFGTAKSLAQHKTAKHGAAETKCDICTRIFSSPRALAQHKLHKHGIQ